MISEDDRLIACFPCTPGSREVPVPVGQWKVKANVLMPYFRWDKSVLENGGTKDDDPGCKSIDELMKALDEYIPMPQREADKPFLMSIEDVFSIKGRGTVATGRVERGRAKIGDEVEMRPFSASASSGMTN